jgi:hypothetical protein
MQFDSEKLDKITRGACACSDDKVIFENPLNWATGASFSPSRGVTNMGLPLRSPVANYRASGFTWLKLAESSMKMVRFRL